VTYPIQPGKVQAPALRDETLARARLLDWLEAKVHSRVIFVIADAGYGKTTLLADFSRRTRVRTIWYRLDEDDRDWVGFLSHLVAAGREHDPGFAPRTTAMLSSLESGGPTRDDAIAMFLKELPAIAGDGSAALVLDDFHLADEVADVRLIVREILARAPERLSVVFASRRQPPIPVSKLRAIGELAELGIADLRFSDAELEQLFRETYQRPLEPDVLMELARRTEGWAASLTLVQAALRERSPAETRAFVRGLSGARDELHDYLAEEVVGDLPQIHQQFLMRTSVLQVVTPELAQIATGLEAVEVQSLMLESERLGLLGRRPNRRSSAQRYHPLVREFLEERLRRAIGPSGVEELHVAVARWAEATDWRTAAHHFGAAQHWDDLQVVLDRSVEVIVGSGASLAALELLDRIPLRDLKGSAESDVLRARVAATEGDYDRGLAFAQRATSVEPASDVALGTLISTMLLKGDFRPAVELVERLAESAKSPVMRQVAQATKAVIGSSIDADLAEVERACVGLAELCQEHGLSQFEGTSWLNAAHAARAAGDLGRALVLVRRAIDALSPGPRGPEIASARSLEAGITGLSGDLVGARAAFAGLSAELNGTARAESLIERAEMESLIGDAHYARESLGIVRPEDVGPNRQLRELVEAIVQIRARNGDPDEFATLALDVPNPSSAYRSAALAFRAVAAAMNANGTARRFADEAVMAAAAQGARPWELVANIVRASSGVELSTAIRTTPRDHQYAISFVAELVTSHLSDLDDAATKEVASLAERYSERWRLPLRHEAEAGGPSVLAAARLLDVVGEASDVSRLRRIARRARTHTEDSKLGRRLARRLATRVRIHDLGRVQVDVGDAQPASSQIRRKVLALLCYLLTKPRWAATREEVMEAMWPDIDPTPAVNSLNQSVYYLRRVFEPDYSEETTAGFIHQDSDLLWLDEELIAADSRDCAELVAAFERTRDPAVAMQLALRYRGKFALDFAYEDWAADFREWLHVAWLHIVETQIREDLDAARFDRGILIARRALEVEPRNDELEFSMLKLLRRSGAHSAAAEQYARYANVLRTDIGVEPPSLDTV
jgi:DNA-binding SARP family transcriptional activator